MPDALTITREWFELLEGLPTAESRKNVLYAVSEYAFNGREPEGLTAMEKSVFMNIRSKINARKRYARFYSNHKNKTLESNVGINTQKRWNQTLESNAETASSNQHIELSNYPPRENKFSLSPTGEEAPKRKVFKVPTLEEVKTIIREKGYNVDPEEFYSYHVANGWRVGRNPMKDLRAAIAYWNRRKNQNRSPPKRDYSGI